MLVGSMANTLGSSGGFVAGSSIVEFHQRINSAALVFSAALPALLAVAASTAIEVLQTTPATQTLQENIKALRSVLDTIECISIPSHSPSPVIHLQVRSKYDKHPLTPADKFGQPATLGVGNISLDLSPNAKSKGQLLAPPPSSKEAQLALTMHDLSKDEQTRLLQAIVDDALENGVLLIRQKRLPSIEPKVLDVGPEARPSIRIAVSTAFSKKELEKAAGIIKASCIRVLGKRR